MKILVLQLARLGDIFITWPTIRALKRINPSAEIHILTREKFSSATNQLDSIDQEWVLSTRNIFEPMISDSPNRQEAFLRLEEFVETLKAEKFDRVINLSFSPFSSYLTHFLTSSKAQVSGYTRHSDGYLSIPDDVSAYFYAQVGPGRANRIHLAEIFAETSKVTLEETDWRSPKVELNTDLQDQIGNHPYIVIHVGASETKKTYSSQKWDNMISRLLKNQPHNVVLIGAPSESKIGQEIFEKRNSERVINFVGQTSVQDLFPIIKKSELLIGCDSAPMHIASLTQTPCLNLSFSTVSFWETGPRAPGSRVLYAKDEEDLASDRVAKEAHRMINGEPALKDTLSYQSDQVPSYIDENNVFPEFQWNFIDALYMSGNFPEPKSNNFYEGLVQLNEINQVILEQLECIQDKEKRVSASQIIQRSEELVNVIVKICPDIEPLINWFQTEKIRLGPMDLAELTEKSKNIHIQLAQVMQIYLGDEENLKTGESDENDTLLP